ncbi:RNase adapter RapZ [Pelagibius sp.]|uniref:RNase adapter RapZ n=1 Tax=Pelagibius sp. TaxID=1931238 RepID=UPI0026173AB4|nr:RNase adapter RapZ [Pelagibius sp.]
MAENLHATTVALDGRGVALLGPPGAGKSDLALRLIDRGAVLVSDDQTLLERRDGRLFARAPDSIAGKLEVRGLGIVEMAFRSPVPLVLLAELQPQDRIERLPERAWRELCGLPVPLVALDPSSVSAPERLQLALRDLGTLIMPDDAVEGPARAGEPAGGESVSDQTEIQAQSESETQSGGARRLVLVTGMSGAGRSTALRILEDEGYEAIDNLPLNLLEAVVGAVGLKRPIAVGVDIRTRDFAVGPVLERLDALTVDPRFAATLLFVDCEDEVLGRRFTETRRRHPLAQDRPVADGIVAERRLLAPLRERADLMIDSSNLTPADFRTWLLGHVGLDSAGGMAVFVTSFSFRQGLPREADLVFDVRFLANPHYDPELRPLSGRDAAVADYIGRDPGFGPFLDHLTQMLAPLLPRYEREGKSYLTIAIGCTGGRHRSVFLAERLAAWLGAQGRSVHLDHRDIARDPQRSAARK